MPFNFVDLFSGIGGFHAAMVQNGGNLVLASDIDQRARSLYIHNWTPNQGDLVYGDVRELTEGKCRQVPSHEVLTGGFPCQPFSKSGMQKGVSDERGTLFYNILEVLKIRRPKIVVLENVRNLIGPKHRQDYLRILDLMRELGYAVSNVPTILSPHALPIEHGGAPQHRERVFIVGIHVGNKAQAKKPLSQISAKYPFEYWDPKSWNLKEFLEEVKPDELEKKILSLSPEADLAIDAWNDFVTTFRSINKVNLLPGFPLWTDYWGPYSQLKIPSDTPDWKMNLIKKNIDFYDSNSTWIDPWKKRVQLDSFIPSLRKLEWQAGELSLLDECLIQLRPSGVRVKRPNYIPALVAITQTPILGWERRELSVSEAALLQGFPMGMDFSIQSRAQSLKQLGNAVHVGTASYIFRRAIALAGDLNLHWVDKFEMHKNNK